MDKAEKNSAKVGDTVIARNINNHWVVGVLTEIIGYGCYIVECGVKRYQNGCHTVYHISDGLRVADQMQAEANAIGQVIRQVFDEMEKYNERGEK